MTQDKPWSGRTGVRTFSLVVVLFLVLSWVNVKPGDDAVRSSGGGESVVDDATVEETAAGEAVGGDTGLPTADGAVVAQGQEATPAQKAQQAARATEAAGLECRAGKNGGNTAKGVSATKIKLATTAVLDGQARSLLADSVTGMKAVVDKVNREGGICGRLLDLTVVNDSFNDNDGLRILRNFMEEDYFALPVVPSAEGLGAAIGGGWISRAAIPAVGTDGMREEQYRDPWVWPVASATVTAMRVMAKYGKEQKGAKTFAIVWDQKYKFGREGKDAFRKQVEALGGTVVADQPLDPDQSSYATEANDFNKSCGDAKCDMVAMLLLPATAEKWLARHPTLGAKYTSGAQTLFTDAFAQRCVQAAGSSCHGIAVWTGYNPPIGPLANKPGVAAYIDDVRALNPTIDVNNQFLQGAYLGMSVFVEALKRVGPQLTRERLRDVMDSMTFETDLASTLTWRKGNHAANVRSQSFSLVVSQGSFTGWRDEGTGFLADPAAG
ncbi:MAG: ABC transporter substrate-binding protein [Actinomycetota bacterium]|nr:ABC transporter substrate-binding protein [Actinomycetota bacterium]